jgi:hypothetical protein
VFSEHKNGRGHSHLPGQNWHLCSEENSGYSGSDGRKSVLVRWAGDNGFIGDGRCGTEPKSNG